MKKFEFNNNKQVRTRKIIQELEKILDDLVLEILKRELHTGKRLERRRGKIISLNERRMKNG